MDAIIEQQELSEREIEILNLLNEGLTNHVIAERTGLTLYTVKWYLKQIYSKLYVSNRTQAAAKARELGILSTKRESEIRITSDIPIVLTPFFGREIELAQIDTLLNDSAIRLVTVHGIGGMGKTRFALEVTRRFSPLFVDGVFFVSLAQVEGDFLAKVASTLRLSIYSEDDILRDLTAFLRDKKSLIVLDNFEPFSSQASQIVTLLERTKHLRILITSREILHVRGEVVFPLEGLQTPQHNTNILENGAYQLYIQRARSGYVEFTPSLIEQSVIGEICNLLGGMPLAIEIAAGWSSVLPVEETLPRLQSSLDLLTSLDQDRPTRHQSIRATFDYSWDLLSPQAQQTLMSLSIFDATGFTFEVAEKVAHASPIIIKQLLDTALLQRVGHNRFGFHPLIRQYVRERLEMDSLLLEQVRTKHGSFYYDFVMRHIEAFRSDLDLSIAKSFFNEMFNLDRAWRFALEDKRYKWLETAVEVGYLCEVSSLWKESDFLFAKTFRLVPPDYQVLRSRLLAFRAIYAFHINDFPLMQELALQSWEVLKDTPYAWDAGTALAYLAIAESFLGNVAYGLELLDQVEPLLERDDLPENAYARGAIACARPIFLLYSGHSQDAILLLKQIDVPSWHEVNIHLSQAYIDLGMRDEARKALEKLYHAALNNEYYKSAVYAVFYLEVIDSTPDMLPYKVVQSLIELTHINEHYPAISKQAYYLGLQLLMRGHPKWGRLLLYSTLAMLESLGEIPMMYQYALNIAEMLVSSHTDIAQALLGLIVSDPNCPLDIQQSASKQVIVRDLTDRATEQQAFINSLADLLLGQV